jgi:hypothetical protein
LRPIGVKVRSKSLISLQKSGLDRLALLCFPATVQKSAMKWEKVPWGAFCGFGKGSKDLPRCSKALRQ